MMKKVKYENCPLINVIFQLSFPTILEINEDSPTEFQKKIRNHFPKYNLEVQHDLDFDIRNDVTNTSMSNQIRRVHNFISEDQIWKISLSKNQISISTIKYNHWEDLLKRFKEPLEIFSQIYKQTYFEKVSLRYIDAIDREKLNLGNVKWSSLIKPHILGCLSYQDEHTCVIKNNTLHSEISFENCAVNIVSGLAVLNKNTSNVIFIIDCDYFYSQQVQMADLLKISDNLHLKSSEFFNDAITSFLKEKLKPVDFEIAIE